MSGLAGFEFATASRIVFGEGRLRDLPGLIAGRRTLLVTGRRGSPIEIDAAHHVRVEGEPTIDDARRAAAFPFPDVEMVVAIGGGSALDLGKAAAALIPNGGDPLRLPRGDRRWPAVPSAIAAVHLRADDGRDRIRGDAQRRPGLADAWRQGQPAQPAHAAGGGAGRSRADVRSAAGADGIDRSRRLDAADRAVRQRARQRLRRRDLPRRDPARHRRAAEGLRRRSNGARRDGLRQPVRRPRAGQRRARRRARLRRPDRRPLPRPARGDLRRAAAARRGDERRAHRRSEVRRARRDDRRSGGVRGAVRAAAAVRLRHRRDGRAGAGRAGEAGQLDEGEPGRAAEADLADVLARAL